MLFEFVNIGIVQSAEIEVKGLTVITGLNDTGKSFLSKSIYSVIKTITNADSQANLDGFSYVRNSINQIVTWHRQNGRISDPSQLNNIQQNVPTLIYSNIINKKSQEETLNTLKEYIDKAINDLSIAPLKPQAEIDSIKLGITATYEAIKNYLKEEMPKEARLGSYFDNLIINGLFQEQLNSLIIDSPGQISIKEGGKEILNIKINDNKTTNFMLDINSILFSDATLIESPIILLLADFITNSLAFTVDPLRFNYSRTLPQHFRDLVEKIRLSIPVPDQFSTINDSIQKVIGGQIYLDPKAGGIVYKNKANKIIKLANVANGIKSFGLLQKLLPLLTSDRLLIIDEPEVHLHPKWEIEYARIIVLLSRLGVPIIVSSHSPYFLHGLSTYVNEYNTQDITRFYFGQVNPNGSTRFEDVSHNLNPIFKVLSEPMQELVYKS